MYFSLRADSGKCGFLSANDSGYRYMSKIDMRGFRLTVRTHPFAHEGAVVGLRVAIDGEQRFGRA
jgi:hypothetical protein